MGVEGLSDIEAMMAKFATSLKGEVKKAVVNGALRIENNAKKLCPVDTGHLKGSITHAQVPSDNGIRVDIGTNVEYAKDVEFGANKEWTHKVRLTEKWAKKYGTDSITVTHQRKIAKPYLFPAFSANAPKVQIDIQNAFNKTVSGLK